MEQFVDFYFEQWIIFAHYIFAANLLQPALQVSEMGRVSHFIHQLQVSIVAGR